MTSNATKFTHNGETLEVSLTEKAKEMGITAFSIKGVRWFQKSYGNTYHKFYISALVGGVWVDLGESIHTEYGYGEQYLVSAGEWLIKHGYLDCTTGYCLAKTSVREALNIEHCVDDVECKKDM